MNVESPPIDAIIPFGRSGLVYFKWYQRPCCLLGITLFSPLDCYYFCITYSPQKAKKYIYIVTYSLSYSLIVPCKFISDLRCWVCALGQVLVAGFRSFLSPVCVFPFVFHHNPWTPSSLAVFPLYPSNPSSRHLFCYSFFTVSIKSLLPWQLFRALFPFCPLIHSRFVKLV